MPSRALAATILEKMIRRLNNADKKALTNTVKTRMWHFGSACSGTGMSEVSAFLLFDALKQKREAKSISCVRSTP